MVDLRVLRERGCTPQRLKQVFTAKAPSDGEKAEMEKEEIRQAARDVKKRERLEKLIRARLNEGVIYNLKNSQFFGACDLAWDCAPINSETIPLVLYAQGKINHEQVVTQLKGLSNSSRYIKREGSQELVDVPSFLDVNANLCRSIITRRLAAQSNKYSNLWPFYKYEPRGTSLVDKCRSDALSQAADIMADEYGHRHHQVQTDRDMMVYGFCVDFVRSSWEQDRGLRLVNGATETFIEREGVAFVNAHPSRVFYDNSESLSALNWDLGIKWVGFWDVARYGELKNRTDYWNRDQISYTADFWTEIAAYQQYWNQYYPDTISAPVPIPAHIKNDRKSAMGYYAQQNDDASVIVANLFMKLVPQDWGLGDYPYEVWLRLVVGGEGTVLFAEWLPSKPGSYQGLNADDKKQNNISFLMELMPFQDQMSNLLKVMLEIVRGDLLKMILINTDGLEPENLKAVRDRLKSTNFSSGSPVVVEYSLTKFSELGFDPRQIVTIAETRGIGNALTECMMAMARLMELAEKFANISPNEQGQPAPREISAFEVAQISATTSGVYSFISDAIDEAREAKKRIIYESLVNCKEGPLQVPVIGRYTKDTIQRAGFTWVEDGEMTASDAKAATLLGSARALEHAVIFSSRDGAERPVNTQAANVLVQMLALPPVQTVLMENRAKLYEMINEITRMSASGFDLKLEVGEDEQPGVGPDTLTQLGQYVQQLAQVVQQNTGAIQQIGQQMQQMGGSLQQQEQVNQEQQMALQKLMELAKLVEGTTGEVQKLKQKASLKPMVEYKNAPPDVKRQMELEDGFVPSTAPEPVES